MNDASARAALPAWMQRWLPQVLDALPAAERHATCSDCAMCARPSAGPAPQRIAFDPITRCCTYRPHVANFLAGAVLSAPAGDAGHQSLLQRIHEGDASPLGVHSDARYRLVYSHAMDSSFGRSPALRCPHLADDGGCTVWAHRPAICATWFCKHERGAVGAAQWQLVHRLAATVEQQLSLWCLRALGLPAEQQLAALQTLDDPTLDPSVLDRRPDPLRRRRQWGAWLDREAAFYSACADLVATLDWTDVLQHCGPDLALHAEQARAGAARLADLSLPERLRAGRFQVTGSDGIGLWLHSYSAFDPLQASPDVLALVTRCDGRATDDILAAHEQATGQRPGRLLLRTLLDFGIVEPA